MDNLGAVYRSFSKYVNIVRSKDEFKLVPAYTMTKNGTMQKAYIDDFKTGRRRCADCVHCSSDYHCKLSHRLETDSSITHRCIDIPHCEAFDDVSGLTIIHNAEEMYRFAERTTDILEGEDFRVFYGCMLNTDEHGQYMETPTEYFNGGGKINNFPKEEEYPVVVYFPTQLHIDYSTIRKGLQYISIK